MPMSTVAGRDPLVVLGVDPGSASLGYGVVGRQGRELVCVDHGAFRPPRDLRGGPRLLFLHQALESLLEHHRPHVVSLEEAFLKHNVQSALRLGEVRALVLLAASSRGIPVVEYPTAVAKKAVCGHGAASKEAVREMVIDQLRLSVSPTPHDAADALALALCLLFDPRLDPHFQAAVQG